MSIPPAKPVVAALPPRSGSARKAAAAAAAAPGAQESPGGDPNQAGVQRHSVGNIDYDNVSHAEDADEDKPTEAVAPFRTRSSTIGKVKKKKTKKKLLLQWRHQHCFSTFR